MKGPVNRQINPAEIKSEKLEEIAKNSSLKNIQEIQNFKKLRLVNVPLWYPKRNIHTCMKIGACIDDNFISDILET